VPRVALAVSGGSAKGAFAVGAASRLRDRFDVPRFDVVSGTSTGALMAPFALLDRFSDLEALYSSFETNNVFVRINDALEILRRGYYLNGDPLRNILKQAYTPQVFTEVVRVGENEGRQLLITAVNMQSGRITYFFTGPEPQGHTDRDLIRLTSVEDMVNAIMASAMQPVLMPLEPIGGFQYCDGGVRETAPIRITVDCGCDEVFAVVLTAESEAAEPAELRGLDKILGRTIGLFGQEITRDDMRSPQMMRDAVVYGQQLKALLLARLPQQADHIESVFDEAEAVNPLRGVRVTNLHIIRPSEKLLADSLEFTRNDMRRMIRLGRERVDELFQGGIPHEPCPFVV
jgi:NTE family protein